MCAVSQFVSSAVVYAKFIRDQEWSVAKTLKGFGLPMILLEENPCRRRVNASTLWAAKLPQTAERRLSSEPSECRSTAMARNACLVLTVFLAVAASAIQLPPSVTESQAPDLAWLLQNIEDVARQNSAHARPYQVTREYKVFRGNDRKPISEITAQINFEPP